MKKTIFTKLFILLFAAAIALFAAACSCGKEGGSTPAPQISGGEQEWNGITVFVPDGMELAPSALDSSDPNTVYVQSKNDQLSYFLINLTDESSARASVKTKLELNSGEEVSFSEGGVEWTGVKFKYAGLVDNFEVYANVNGKTVSVSGSRFSCDSAEARKVLSSIKVAE